MRFDPFVSKGQGQGRNILKLLVVTVYTVKDDTCHVNLVSNNE